MRLVAGLIPALTSDVILKLKSVGITNAVSFMLKDAETLAMEIGVSYKDLQSVRRLIRAHSAAIPISGSDMLERAVKQAVIISTGVPSLDSLLGGGLMSGEIVEFCGSWGVGKTSLCSRLAVHAALKLGFRVLYIDSGANMTINRLTPIIEETTESEEVIKTALSRIEIATASDIWGVFRALDFVDRPNATPKQEDRDSINAVEKEKFKLVILDSLPPFVLPLFSNSKKVWAVINQLGSSLKQTAVDNQTAVVVVNNVVSANYDADNLQRQDFSVTHWKAALGRYWAHVPNTRLCIDKTDAEKEANKIYVNKPKGKTNIPLDNSASGFQIQVTIWKSNRLKTTSATVSIV